MSNFLLIVTSSGCIVHDSFPGSSRIFDNDAATCSSVGQDMGNIVEVPQELLPQCVVKEEVRFMKIFLVC